MDASFNQQTIYVICFRKGMANNAAGLYCLMTEVTGDVTPIVHQGKIVFFTHLDMAASILTDAGFEPLHFQKDDVLIFDVNEVVDLIRKGENDDDSVIINFINTISDIFKKLEIKVPVFYKDDLISFSDHITFSKYLKEFFAERRLPRDHLADAVMWCMGALLCSSTIA